jgi:hypothetical protein
MSQLHEVENIEFPEFSGVRVMMLPVVLGDESSLPSDILAKVWHEPVSLLAEIAIGKMPDIAGFVGYLTIDEAVVKPGLTHRRPGLHTDGYAEFTNDTITLGGWSGGPWAAPKREKLPKPQPEEPPKRHRGGWSGGPWSASGSLGMLSASSIIGCEAFDQTFEGVSGSNGDCSHLIEQLDPTSKVVLEPGRVYAMDGDTVHRSLRHMERTARQFVRLSMPSEAAWYEGYTRNPLGIEPSGPILPPRSEFMQWGDHHA